MQPQIIDCIQGSPEWEEARRGLPTASNFKSVNGDKKTRNTYMRELAGEIITGQSAENFVSPAMQRGKDMEAEARANYAIKFLVEPQLVGFVRNGDIGCSPDAFIGDDGILEIKTQTPKLLIATIEADKFPAEHVAQCQGALLVTGRKWIDLCIYWPRMPLFVKRAYRDENYIQALANELDQFNLELAQMVERIRDYKECT